jgi:hypothetical protein
MVIINATVLAMAAAATIAAMINATKSVHRFNTTTAAAMGFLNLKMRGCEPCFDAYALLAPTVSMAIIAY